MSKLNNAIEQAFLALEGMSDAELLAALDNVQDGLIARALLGLPTLDNGFVEHYRVNKRGLPLDFAYTIESSYQYAGVCEYNRDCLVDAANDHIYLLAA